MVAVESGPYIRARVVQLRATSGSDTTKLVCSQYPIRSGIDQDDLLTERPVPTTPTNAHDRDRYVMAYDPSTGPITPDLDWIIPPIAAGRRLELRLPGNVHVRRARGDVYGEMEDLGAAGIGERFEILNFSTVLPSGSQKMTVWKRCWIVCRHRVRRTAWRGASRPGADRAVAQGRQPHPPGGRLAAGTLALRRRSRSTTWCTVTLSGTVAAFIFNTWGPGRSTRATCCTCAATKRAYDLIADRLVAASRRPERAGARDGRGTYRT